MRRRRTNEPARGCAALVGLVATLALAGLVLEARVPVPLLTAVVVALVAGAVTFNLVLLGVPVSAPSTLFMAALTLFHLGLIVPWSLGASAPAWLEAAPPPFVERALLCVIVAFAALELGLLFGWKRLGRAAPPPLAPVLVARRVPSAFHSAGLLLAGFAALGAFANLCMIGLDRFLGTSYGYELYASTDSRFVQTGLYWLLPASLVVSLAGARPGIETRRTLAAAATVVMLLFWVGDRGGAVSFSSASLVVWTYTRGALPLRSAVLAGLALLFMLPFVGAIRLIPRNGVTMESLQEAAVDASPLGEAIEMGSTFRPLIDTLRLVPDEAPYRLGQSYLGALRRVVPNTGLLPVASDWNDPSDLPPNHWITYMVEPWTYAAFGGLGFSAIAEPYLNFGLLGIVAYFLGLGFALARTELVLAAGAPRRILALTAVIFMPLLLTVRNDFYNFVRPATWGVGIVLAIERVHGKRRMRRVVRRAAPAPAVARAPRVRTPAVSAT